VKKFLLCVVFVVVFALTSVSAKTIQVNIDNEDVKVNSSITLSFAFDEIKQLKGLQFDILYDAESLVLKGTEKGSAFDDALVGGMSTDKNGTIKVVIAYSSEIDFSGEICSAEFEVLDGKKNVSVKVSNIKVASNDDETFEETEKLIVVADATEAEQEDSDEEDFGDNNSGSAGANTGSHGARPSGGHSDVVNNSAKKDSSPNNNSTSGNEDDKESLFVDSDVSSMNDTNKSEKVFADTVGHWAEASIHNMAGLGIVNGVSETEFQPDRGVTRAEFATLVSKVLDLDEASENVYSDVDDEAWYKTTVLNCTKVGLIQGSGGLFRPDDFISREEMAVILYRTMKYIDPENVATTLDVVAFADVSEISDWAREEVDCMVQNGIINGMGNNIFAPKSSATRAQAVVVLEKILKFL